MLGAAALLSGGASLLSGLFGQSSARKQARKEEEAIRRANDAASKAATSMNTQIRARADAAALVPVQTSHETFSATTSQGGVDMKAFMAAAEENGFNPLTFLRSGALSLFSNSVGSTYTDDFTCTTGERAMDAALSGTYLPQLSPVIANTHVPGMGEIFGNALTAGVNQYLGDYNQQQQNNFQKQLLGSQIQGANRNGSYAPRMFSVPSTKLTGGDVVTAVPFKKPGDSLCLFGYCMKTDPGTSSSEDVETRYGDIAQNLWGPLAAMVDIGVAVNTPLAAAIAANSWIKAGDSYLHSVRTYPVDPETGLPKGFHW